MSSGLGPTRLRYCPLLPFVPYLLPEASLTVVASSNSNLTTELDGLGMGAVPTHPRPISNLQHACTFPPLNPLSLLLFPCPFPNAESDTSVTSSPFGSIWTSTKMIRTGRRWCVSLLPLKPAFSGLLPSPPVPHRLGLRSDQPLGKADDDFRIKTVSFCTVRWTGALQAYEARAPLRTSNPLQHPTPPFDSFLVPLPYLRAFDLLPVHNS